MRPLLLVASLLATAVSGGAIAGQLPPAPTDAVLTRADALARADARFAEIDTDRDGKISASERDAIPAPRRGPAAEGAEGRGGRAGMGGVRGIERADTDRDGFVTRAEFAAQAAAMFDRQDLNKDGKVDAAERATLREQRRERRGDRADD
ncbi:hypothetical protein [Sphingomonas sp. CFBP 13720]|uniref:hypothetical protein n=1 Tax=Sphingomonas sp. CFBP 13720 TaxID=2775302 RepID=UPI001785A51B|nr:hypothetical protein [Sphingomonas sp. CFBP 13720]MBD8677194.1 hypothetical protein [Sphingomonas sp. CFBP 13720]